MSKFILSGSVIVQGKNGLVGTITPDPVEFATAQEACEEFAEWAAEGFPPAHKNGRVLRIQMQIEVVPNA